MMYVELGCVFHELGHTLGLSHAAELRADGSPNVYGDKSDGLMGSGFNSHVNVVNKLQAGWLTGARLQTVDMTGTATYNLAAQSVGADTLQVLEVVNKGAQPVTGVVDTFVSFRNARGFDRQLPSGPSDLNGDSVANAVLIHQRHRGSGGNTIYLQALEEGESYDEYGVSVTVERIVGDEATVTVTRAPYEPQPPEIVITPGSLDAQPLQNRYYTVSITNTNDPLEVDFESVYDVSFDSIGAGWIMGWTSTAAKSVAPGETRNFFFRLLSPYDVAPGSYDFTLVATGSRRRRGARLGPGQGFL